MKISIRAMAYSIGMIWGGGILILGLINYFFPTYASEFLKVVASIYPGYHASQGLQNLAIGTIWAFLDGAIGGAILAWLYNCFA